MKLNQKWTLFLLATFVSFFGIVNTLLKGTKANEEVPVNVTFDDINFYKCVVENYNDQFNKEFDYLTTNLTDNELSLLTVLECSGSSKKESDKITSTKGLEKLVSLEKLDLSYNLLTMIDLSKNVNINYLNVSNNKLTEIDLSNNKKLNTYITDGNELSSEDINNEEEFKTDLPSTNIFSIELSEGEINFDTEVTEYSITVSSFDELDVYVKLESSTSSYTVDKNIVDDEKIVVIMVMANDGSSKVYTIIVTEDNLLNQDTDSDEMEEKKNYFVPIFIGIICVLVFINVFRIVRNIKK